MVKNHLHTFVCALVTMLAGILPTMQISAQTVDSEVTATWPFDLGTEGQTATITPADGGEWFKSCYVLAGSKIAFHDTRNVDGTTQTRFQPTEQASGPSDDNMVRFVVSPKTGLKFTPSKVSFTSTRFGTDGGNIDIAWVNPDGSKITLAEGESPLRDNKTPPYTNYSYDISGATIAEGECGLQINVYKLGANKQIGFANIIIEGKVEGTVQEVKQCNLTIQVTPEGAGTVSVQPAGSMTFDENTEITLSQTRNFGYKFTGWSVGGETVSTDDTYKFDINGDVTVTAEYESIATYSLTYGATGGGKEYMITPMPAPTVVDGKNMYEEGQEVTLTAAGNYILDFANWSSGETTAELKLAMDGDKDVTANFSPRLDCIAGWDFYLEGGDSRKADFHAADNDVDMLIMRDEAGEIHGWLDKSIMKSGGQEGRGAAVNWQTDSEKTDPADPTELGRFYWQTQINAEAFSNIQVHSAMLFNYNTYSKFDVQYSLDNSTWSTVGSFTLANAKEWVEQTFSLPAEANNQATIYIRWIADKTSPKVGTLSENDGISISDIYITGTEELVDDGTAPVLLSTVPAEGSDNASANGRIVLNFDEKVKVAEGAKATLGNGTELEPLVSGKSIMFEYKGLNYSTQYTFTLPANTVSDLTDNYIDKAISLNFTTMTRPVVAKAMYDFIVPDDGTVSEALEAAAKREDTSKRFYIFIRQDDYVIPASETATVKGSDGKNYPDPRTTVNTPNVSIIGEGIDNTSIVNTVPDVPSGTSNPIEGLGNCETLNFAGKATGIYMQDITIKNGLNDNTGRGAALEDGGNKNVFKNVRLYGYQDTYLSNNLNGRFYFEGGELRGRTDFLCGKGDVYYNGVTLMMCDAGGYIAVPSQPKKYGYIFKDCVIKGEKDGIDGNYTLGRPWGSGTPIALYIDTRMEAQPTAAGWNEMSGGWPARFAEYNSTTATGTTIDLSNRKKAFGKDGDKHDNNPILTEEEAAFYTIANVMGADDDWDPTALTEQASAPTNVEIYGNTLTWDDNQYVLCWAVCKDGRVSSFTTEPTFIVDDANAKYSVRAANQMGGLGEATEATIGTGIDEVDATTDGEAISTAYYSVQGERVSSSYRGVVIEVKTMADGSKTVRKTIMK